MTEQQLTDPSKSAGFISTLEKASEGRTALLLFAFLLFFDSAMTQVRGWGVYDLYAGKIPIGVNLFFDVAVIFIFFSLFMSMAMPLIGEFIRIVLITVFHSLVFRLTNDMDELPSRWRGGYVRPYEVIKAWHQTRDDYFLEVGKEAKEAQQKERTALNARFRMLFLAIACLVLAAFNCLYDRGSGFSLLQHIEREIPGGFWVVVVFINAFLIAAIRLANMDDERFVYCPSLAQKHVEAMEKADAEKRRYSRR